MKISEQLTTYVFLLFNFVRLSALLPLLQMDSDGHSYHSPEENLGAKMFLAEGDILIDRKRSIDSAYHLMWLNRSVPYEFDVNFGQAARKEVDAAMKVLEKKSCVRFKPRTNEVDYVHILVPDYSSRADCYSKVGRNGGRQELGLRSICPFGTVIHELLHALGLWHEHNRSDRDDFITVLWDNIEAGKRDNFHQYGGPNQDVILQYPYEYGSIMHYADNMFSKNDQKPTLKAKKPIPPGVVMGQRVGPSKMDITKLNAFYMCDIMNCSNPGMLKNGHVNALKFAIGSKVSYSCQPGYVLIGAPERVCLTMGHWSGDPPSCVPSTKNHPTHYCNFDHPRHSLCGWTNSVDDDGLDWTLNSGTTHTRGTGPYWDHTLNTASGLYLYVEASSTGSQIRSKGLTARLKSSRFEADSHSNTCLVFFTNMYGRYMGNLSVYKQDEGSPYSQKELLFTMEGDQGIKWRQIFLILGKTTKPFYIYFEGSIGGYSSDIAIDDVTVGQCNNFKPLAVSGGLLSSLSCSFDDGHLCRYLQGSDDSADWNITRGATLTYQTGPNCDPLNCSTGRYLYLEASQPRRQGDTAKLRTPVIGGQGPSCLSFYYHMYGEHIGSLNIKMLSATSGHEVTLWSKSGNQGNRWFTKFLEYDALEAYEISIEGVVGSSYRGDIAIDDVSIASGRCTGLMKFNCSFEQDKCGWQNIQIPGDTKDWRRHSGETDTSYTGPSADRLDADGHYIYVESSRSFENDLARLISPSIPQSPQGYCLSFWYHMYGSMSGNLTVYLQSEIGHEVLVWRTSGDHGNHWLSQRLHLTSFPSQSLQVIFEVMLRGYRGDTAIDDITIQRGPCVT